MVHWATGGGKYVPLFHYIGDFIVVGPPDSSNCQRCLDTLERVCEILGVPLAPDKKDGPTWRIIFLGIIIDTLTGELSLCQRKSWRDY